MSNSNLVSFTMISPNKNSPRNHAIDTITIHCVVNQASVENGCEWFSRPEAKSSPNYYIGTEGRIGLCVDESDRSWCTSSAANDNRAITIECASDTTEPYAINDAVYASLIELCADICKRNGIPKMLWVDDKNLIGQTDKQNVTVHRWFANKSCPGQYIFERLPKICAEVNAKLGSVDPVPAPEPITYPELPFEVKVIIDDLHIRTKPSMDGNVVGDTKKGVFTIVSVNEGWGELKSGAGWIWLNNPQYCTILGHVDDEKTDEPSTDVFEVKVDISYLNIRKGPGTNFPVDGQTGIGTFHIVETQNGPGSPVGWGKLQSGAGWISLEFAKRI